MVSFFLVYMVLYLEKLKCISFLVGLYMDKASLDSLPHHIVLLSGM